VSEVNHEIKPFIQLATFTAMLRSEQFSLRCTQVDLDEELVFLYATTIGKDQVFDTSNAAVTFFKKLNPITEGRIFRFTHVDTPSEAFRTALLKARTCYSKECERAGSKQLLLN